MDILDVMDLLDLGHPLTNRGSPLLDTIDGIEPNNLSQSSARAAETAPAADGETASAAQAFTERTLELKLPILSSSSSESDSEEPANPTAGTSATIEGERVASPPPNCAICLGRCKNKCFTDSCMHQFCFKCLCEWSKVKPECPLCKQTFKSIIHNVKSIDQFEEYHVQPPTVQIAHPSFEMDIFDVVYPVGHNRIQAWNGSTYRPYFFESSAFSTAAAGGSLPTASGSNSNRSIANSANGSGLRNQYVYRGELLDLYRQEYPGAIANSGTLSQLWRRYVYDRKLYAMPVADITGRFRESSARFYRDNPSQIHRLMPWINRDIVCLLRQTQHDVTAVLESINSALTIMNILSPAFRRRLQPILNTKTSHFIHELNNFARSPYDMIGYDRAVQYSPQVNNEEIVIEFTSSDESIDNDQIDVAGDDGNNNTSSSSRTRSSNATSTNAINLTIHNRLTSTSANAGGSRGGANIVGLSDMQDDVNLVIDLRGESDNNETTSTAQATNNSSNYLNGQNASTSESDMITSGAQPAVSENIELTSGSSDECEFVLERKPPHLRTPEMVSLDSASDSDVVFVDESKTLNKTSFSSSEGELNENPSDHRHHSRHHIKIAALVEAKKRNQSANVVKSEQQDSHTEVYNLGASTSAALRLSLQKQIDKSHRSDGGASGKRLRRNKYCLRNSDSQSRAERQTPKRRGKRLDSESSHSSTSSSTTISSSSTTTSSSQSSSSSSDEDYVASTSQRKKTTAAGGGEYDTRNRGRKVRKPKKRKASTSNNRRTAKRDSKRQKNNNYSNEYDDDEDENNHMGKNFALVMAINERRKRQNQNKCSKAQENQEEESEGENSWRLKAVNEPLRKQQQQQAKISHKNNERKRQRKTSTQQQPQPQRPIENRNNRKRQKYENQTQQEKETQKRAKNLYNSENTSSDESDNINLIQLKTKLTGLGQTNINQVSETAIKSETEMTTNNGNNSENDINATVTSTTTNTATATIYAATTENTTIPTAASTKTMDILTNSPADATTVTTRNETNNIVDVTTTQNDLFNFSEDSDYTIQNDNDHDHIDNNNHDSVDQQHLNSSSSNNYNDNNQEDSSHINNNDNANHNGDNAADDETLSNIPTSMNLNESNAFADGTSMSTTTTDTILHEAAEQISSAAVNFYNAQQTFNTADFADENSTNSSSSYSSISSSTTSLSTSSNSSSSNTHSHTNYDRS